MGKRSAVDFENSGQSVANSDPELSRPTPPARAGRKPDACPHFVAQRKSWPGARDLEGPAENRRERDSGSGLPPAESAGRAASALNDALPNLSPEDLSALIRFFQLLDRWDREAIDAR